jgi:hypothetical protein
MCRHRSSLSISSRNKDLLSAYPNPFLS